MAEFAASGPTGETDPTSPLFGRSFTDPAAVLDAYLSASCPEEWLRDEVGSWLYEGFAGDVDDRLEDLDQMLEDERDRLDATDLDGDDVVAFSLRITDRDGVVQLGRWGLLPSPMLLMALLTGLAGPGDEVEVCQQRADGSAGVFTVCWPFDMATAEMLTAPVLPARASSDASDGVPGELLPGGPLFASSGSPVTSVLPFAVTVVVSVVAGAATALAGVVAGRRLAGRR